MLALRKVAELLPSSQDDARVRCSTGITFAYLIMSTSKNHIAGNLLAHRCLACSRHRCVYRQPNSLRIVDKAMPCVLTLQSERSSLGDNQSPLVVNRGVWEDRWWCVRYKVGGSVTEQQQAPKLHADIVGFSELSALFLMSHRTHRMA